MEDHEAIDPQTGSPPSARNFIRRENISPNPVENIPLVDKPPLAGAESSHLDGDTQVSNHDIDDAIQEVFFNDKQREEMPDHVTDNDGIPIVITRAGPDGGSEVDQVDGDKNKPSVQPNNGFLNPTRFPPFGTDPEAGSMNPDLESIPDVNVYQHKKTLAQGMMDLALFSANANQLRYVLESSSRHPYYYPSLVFITISLLFQVAVGVGLIWNSTFNVKDDREICIANKINNFTVIGIFIVTVTNVFISAFGVATAPAGTT